MLGDVVGSPNGKFLYVTDDTENSVTVVDTATKKRLPSRIAVPAGAVSEAIAPNGNYLYVANSTAAGVVSVIQLQ
jgi:YVTN family beta-propeller protein